MGNLKPRLTDNSLRDIDNNALTQQLKLKTQNYFLAGCKLSIVYKYKKNYSIKYTNNFYLLYRISLSKNFFIQVIYFKNFKSSFITFN